MRWKLFANLAEEVDTREVELDLSEDATFRDALDALCMQYPTLEEEVLDGQGEMRDHIRALHNGEDPFRSGDGYETRIADDDELALFPPVSGG